MSTASIPNQDQLLLKEINNDNWLRQSLFVPVRGNFQANARSSVMAYNGTFSAQKLSFADTSLGGNRSINPKPQFTKNADPNLPSLIASTVDNGNPGPNNTMGMGRYYSEAIEANAQRIYMQFGVPAYNSLTNFFSTFYDSSHGTMANSGQAKNDILYTMGKYLGYITLWSIIPELCIASLLYGTAQKAIASVQNRPLTKFYYMKPTMALYWSTVTTIVNAIAVNMHLMGGVNPGEVTTNQNQQGANSSRINFNPLRWGQTQDDINTLSNLLPGIMLPGNGGIDIRMVANKYQRLADAHRRALLDIQNSSSSYDIIANAIQGYLTTGAKSLKIVQPPDVGSYYRGTTDTQSNSVTNAVSNNAASLLQGAADAVGLTASKIADIVSGNPNAGNPSAAVTPSGTDNTGYINSAAGLGTDLLEAIETLVNTATNSDAAKQTESVVSDAVSATSTTIGNLWAGLTSHFTKYADFVIAEERDGSSFVNFVVDYESHVSESFNSSTRESDIAAKMNEMSRSNKSKYYDLAGGNLDSGVLATIAGKAAEGVAALVSGVADSVGFSGLAILGGRAFVDIPEFWDTSTSSFPNSSYTIQLRTPYGNPISVLTNIYVPLAMLIAGAAPRSTGRNSYTGPFLCKLWQKGKTQIQLGLITALNITRGTGNVGWSVQQHPLGIDVSFTVTNLSKMLHIPISSDLNINDVLGISMFDETNNFTDYMAILGSLGLKEQYYFSSRWRLRKSTVSAKFDSFLSMNNFLTWATSNDSTPGSILGMFAQQGNL